MKLVSFTPEVNIVTATKPLVDALLAMNTSNRKSRQMAVDRLATDIEEGHWKLTASGVGVDSRGILSDGQHRLLAIKQAGYPAVPFVLAIGLHPDAQSVVDRHAKRSLADALSLVHGRTISTSLVAASNQMLSIRNATNKTGVFSVVGGGPSDASAAANLILWEDELSAVLPLAGGVRASVVAALAIYYRQDKERASVLCDQIKRGLGLEENDPAYRLRLSLKQLGSQGGAQGSLRSFSNTVSAIIAHANDRPVRLLKGSESWGSATWKVWKA